MPDYRQQTGEANSWRRARQVGITNERGTTPTISFQEEDVVIFDGTEFRTPAMSSVRGFFDPAAEIPLVNPDTGELTGQVATQGQLYQIVHSLYIQLAQQRDAEVAAQQPPVAPPPGPPSP